MAKKPKYEPDDKEQSERYIETARKLGVDESGKSFDRAFKTITSPKNREKKKNNK